MSDESLPPPVVDETAEDGSTPERIAEPPVASVSAESLEDDKAEEPVMYTAAAGAPSAEESTVAPLQWVKFVTEKKEGQGQDGPPILHSWSTSEGTRSIIAVFDGMGGAGSTMVPDIDGDGQVPMAYLASRAAARAFTRGFSQMTSTMSPPEITTLLEEAVVRELRELLEREGGSPISRVRGPMIKNYPTTIAAAIIDDVPDGRRVWPMWAGDSRIYALSPGDLLLQQLTTDHTASGESSDGGDAALTRCATPERVDLDSVEYLLPADTIIFAATDGCFAYQPTQYLLTALIEEMDRSHTCDEYSTLLARALASVSGDDCAVSMLLPAGATFADTRNLFRPWLRDLQDVRHVPRNNRFLTLASDSTFLRLRQEKQGS